MSSSQAFSFQHSIATKSKSQNLEYFGPKITGFLIFMKVMLFNRSNLVIKWTKHKLKVYDSRRFDTFLKKNCKYFSLPCLEQIFEISWHKGGLEIVNFNFEILIEWIMMIYFSPFRRFDPISKVSILKLNLTFSADSYSIRG